MTKITQKSRRVEDARCESAQLIESLKQLKEIKPRKEWAVLLKSQILTEQKSEPIQAQSAGFIDTLKFLFAPRKLAYSFAVVLFLIVGVFGTIKLLPTEKVVQQPATLTNQTAAAIKDQISATVKNLAQNLKDNPVQNPQTMKTLVKTLAYMPGDVASSQDVKDLMQTVVESQIVDLQKTTLTDEQNNTLIEIEDLYAQGKYSEALEKILLINN